MAKCWHVQKRIINEGKKKVVRLNRAQVLFVNNFDPNPSIYSTSGRAPKRIHMTQLPKVPSALVTKLSAKAATFKVFKRRTFNIFEINIVTDTVSS